MLPSMPQLMDSTRIYAGAHISPRTAAWRDRPRGTAAPARERDNEHIRDLQTPE